MGESAEYSVPHHPGHWTESEIKSYRAAFGAIAGQFNSLNGLRTQLEALDDLPIKQEANAESGRWQVRSKLLNLGQSQILLCRLSDEFAVIERFQEESAYAKENGVVTEVLWQGKHVDELADEFKANAHHTLRYMASNLTAKAQKIVWEVFLDSKPAEIMAAITDRCRQSVRIDEMLEVQLT